MYKICDLNQLLKHKINDLKIRLAISLDLISKKLIKTNSFFTIINVVMINFMRKCIFNF